MYTLLKYILVYLVIAFSVTPYFSGNEYLLATVTTLLGIFLLFRGNDSLNTRYVRFIVLLVGVLVIQGVILQYLEFRTLTREEVLERNLPCRTIAAAVEAGYLEKVSGFEKLDRGL